MSSDEFTYRSATIKDAAELIELSVAAYGPYTALLNAEHANKLSAGLKDEQRMVSLLQHSKSFVCIHQNKIVGMAFIVLHGNPWDVFKAEWAYIRLLGVHPDYQGKGIAKQLTHMCITFAKDHHEKTVALHTSEFMDTARHMYEKLGFKKYQEIEPRFGKKYWLYLLDIN